MSEGWPPPGWVWHSTAGGFAAGTVGNAGGTVDTVGTAGGTGDTAGGTEDTAGGTEDTAGGTEDTAGGTVDTVGGIADTSWLPSLVKLAGGTSWSGVAKLVHAGKVGYNAGASCTLLSMAYISVE